MNIVYLADVSEGNWPMLSGLSFYIHLLRDSVNDPLAQLQFWRRVDYWRDKPSDLIPCYSEVPTLFLRNSCPISFGRNQALRLF